MKRLGILISGRGSNLEAIADNVARGTIDAEIAIVIASRTEARGLEAARLRGLPAVAIPSKGLDREVYDRMLLDELRKHAVDLVCLAGFMRLLSASFGSSLCRHRDNHDSGVKGNSCHVRPLSLLPGISILQTV